MAGHKGLPLFGSSAAETLFCAERIDGADGTTLWIDGNQKVTAGNGSYAEPRPNAFSILQVSDCPFRTPTCEAGCYVQNIEAGAPETHRLYRSNSATIRRILDGGSGLSGGWAARVAGYIIRNCAGGFRWHVSGDLFSLEYAEWVAKVVRYSPGVPHWIYTRSFPWIEPLLGRPNLSLNLSCDRDNYWLARRYAEAHGLRLCFMTSDGELPDDLPKGSVVFPDYALRGIEGEWWAGLDQARRRMVCPVDLVGKSRAVRCGPCKKCLRPNAAERAALDE